MSIAIFRWWAHLTSSGASQSIPTGHPGSQKYGPCRYPKQRNWYPSLFLSILNWILAILNQNFLLFSRCRCCCFLKNQLWEKHEEYVRMLPSTIITRQIRKCGSIWETNYNTVSYPVKIFLNRGLSFHHLFIANTRFLQDCYYPHQINFEAEPVNI